VSVYVPIYIYSIYIEGNDIYPRIADDVISITYTDDAEDKTKSQISITLADTKAKYSKSPLLKVQTRLSAGLKVEDPLLGKYEFPFGEFTITQLRGKWRQTLSLVGTSWIPNREKLREVKNLHFEEVSLSDLVTQLVKSAGFEPILERVPDLHFRRIELKNQTIEDFLKDLATKYGLNFFVKGSKVVFGDISPKELGLPTDQLLELEYNLDTKKSYSKIVVEYYDNEKNKLYRYEYDTGLPGDVYYHTEKVQSEAEAMEIAKGLARKLNSNSATLTVLLSGFPVYAGSIVNINLGGAFDGRYKIFKAVHTIDKNQGWRTKLLLKLP
jgi:phage protein D